jgi:hypothetical protein
LAAEVVASVTDNPSVEVCISATPPLAQKHARYMIKRLTTAVPAATLLTALWGASDERIARLQAITSVPVVATAREAVAEIRRRISFPDQSKPPALLAKR